MSIKEDLETMLAKVIQDESEDALEEFHKTLCVITYSCIIDSYAGCKKRVAVLHDMEGACWRIRIALEDKRHDIKAQTAITKV